MMQGKGGRQRRVATLAVAGVFVASLGFAGLAVGAEDASEQNVVDMHASLGVDIAEGAAQEWPNEFCLECHEAQWDEALEAGDGTKDAVTSYDASGTYNPHRNHRSDESCTSCHRADEEPTLTCTKCREVEIPQDWTSYYAAEDKGASDE